MVAPPSMLTTYKGRLSPGAAALGMNAAIRNARRLAADATRLLQAGSFATCVGLASLAIEEVGKVQLLRRLALAPDDQTAKAIWREVRSHKSKGGLWGIAAETSNGAVSLGSLGRLIDPSDEYAGQLDALKQLGFYSDCYGAGRWSEPEQAVSEGLASYLVSVACALSQRSEITVREMELWVRFVAPAGADPQKMGAAVCEWHRAMIAAGLSNRSQEEFEKFIAGEPVARPWGETGAAG